MASEDRLIPTLAMAQDPRLRRLFALVGLALDEPEIIEVEDDLRAVMLDIAPEYLPPDDTDDDTLYHEWWALVRDAR